MRTRVLLSTLLWLGAMSATMSGATLPKTNVPPSYRQQEGVSGIAGGPPIGTWFYSAAYTESRPPR